MTRPPDRDGLNPVRLRLPDGAWPTVLDYLEQRFGAVRDGQVLLPGGDPVTRETPYAAANFVWVYRDPRPEPPVPFEIEVLYRDADLLVVDKPHFLATMPRGRHVVETALVRLRRQLELPDLSPAHRLDRLTAGVLMFTVHPAARRKYQMLFADRQVRKEYEAIAPYRRDLALPTVVRSHIVKHRGVLQAHEIDAPPNTETAVQLLEVRGDHARYRLLPHTGKTHQLRVHLCGLGIPIVGDPLYPAVCGEPDDYANPLRLLARSLHIDGHDFVSRRRLDWP